MMMLSGVPRGSVEDAALDLIRASRRLEEYRIEADRVAADLDARWARNRNRQTAALGAAIPPQPAQGEGPN